MKAKKIIRVHATIMECTVMLGELIGKLISPMTPMDVEFPLEFTIF